MLYEVPEHPDALRLLGEVLIDLGQTREAVAKLKRLIAGRPEDFAGHFSLGNAYRLAGQTKAAIASYQAALALNPDFAGAHHGLGLALRLAERETEAVACFKQAVRARPDWAVAWKDLGLALAVLGKLQRAEAAFERAVQLHPGLGDAQLHLAEIRRDVAAPRAIAKLESALADPRLPPAERAEILFTLGRMADKEGAYDLAFRHISAANSKLRAAQRKAGLAFDVARLTRDVDQLIEVFTSEIFAGFPAGSDSEAPVFIVGMPRAGSTLFEQIASSHSQVFGAGERTGIGDIAGQLGWRPSLAWTLSALRDSAQDYLEGLRQRSGAAMRLIDKMPDNMFQLGLVAGLFPKARVIFCARDPRDVAISCFFQNFSHPYGFDTDLADCAFRIREIERLTRHWQSVLPLRHMTMSYEDLLASPEAEIRRMISFLGLDWQAACLNFHLNPRPVRTASWAQVRQPLYRASVGRWRRYASQMADLKF